MSLLNRLYVLFLSVCIAVSCSFGQSLSNNSNYRDSSSYKIENAYLGYEGVTEKPRGSNWGPEVKDMLMSVNVKTPAAWCAAFVKKCLDIAGIKSTITAWSPTAHNKKNVVYFKGKWHQEFMPGDVFTIFYPSMKRIAHTGFGHRRNKGQIVTMEGNTNNDGSRDGYGVFRRIRSINSIYSITRWR